MINGIMDANIIPIIEISIISLFSLLKILYTNILPRIV